MITESANQKENETPDNQATQPKPYYLQEALRLSELRLEKQDDTFLTLERKASLLGTLYIAIIAYLGSLDMLWNNSNPAVAIIMSVLMLALAVATFISASVLFISDFGIAGVNPKHFMDKSDEQDFDDLAKDLLKKYAKRHSVNEKTNTRKATRLQISLQLGFVSIILLGGVALLVIAHPFGLLTC